MQLDFSSSSIINLRQEILLVFLCCCNCFCQSVFFWVLLETGCLSSVVESESLGLVSVIGKYFVCNTISYKDGPACFSYSVQLSCSRAQKFAAILAYWVE